MSSPPASPATPAEQRVLLGNVSWKTFLELAESASNPRGRLAYDQGVLEIMSPSMLHESVKKLIGRMIETFSFESGIEIRSVSATTLKRPDLEKGVESDECYYVAHAEAIKGVDKLDLTIHPPPDIAVEVDITRSSTLKLRIYAGIGVPEFWRYDGESLRVFHLATGEYVEGQSSAQLRGFPFDLANQLLRQRNELSENQMLRCLVDSLRQSTTKPVAERESERQVIVEGYRMRCSRHVFA